MAVPRELSVESCVANVKLEIAPKVSLDAVVYGRYRQSSDEPAVESSFSSSTPTMVMMLPLTLSVCPTALPPNTLLLR